MNVNAQLIEKAQGHPHLLADGQGGVMQKRLAGKPTWGSMPRRHPNRTQQEVNDDKRPLVHLCSNVPFLGGLLLTFCLFIRNFNG